MATRTNRTTGRFRTKVQPEPKQVPVVENIRREGDIYVKVLFNDGRPRVASGRDYGVMIKGQSYFVDPIDLAKHPYLFKEIPKEKWPDEPIGDSVLVSTDLEDLQFAGEREGTLQDSPVDEESVRSRRARRFGRKVGESEASAE